MGSRESPQIHHSAELPTCSLGLAVQSLLPRSRSSAVPSTCLQIEPRIPKLDVPCIAWSIGIKNTLRNLPLCSTTIRVQATSLVVYSISRSSLSVRLRRLVQLVSKVSLSTLKLRHNAG